MIETPSSRPADAKWEKLWYYDSKKTVSYLPGGFLFFVGDYGSVRIRSSHEMDARGLFDGEIFSKEPTFWDRHAVAYGVNTAARIEINSNIFHELP